MSRNETHTVREGDAIQIGDSLIVFRKTRKGKATVRVIEPDGRRIQRIDLPRTKGVESPALP